MLLKVDENITLELLEEKHADAIFFKMLLSICFAILF